MIFPWRMGLCAPWGTWLHPIPIPISIPSPFCPSLSPSHPHPLPIPFPLQSHPIPSHPIPCQVPREGSQPPRTCHPAAHPSSPHPFPRAPRVTSASPESKASQALPYRIYFSLLLFWGARGCIGAGGGPVCAPKLGARGVVSLHQPLGPGHSHHPLTPILPAVELPPLGGSQKLTG